MSRVALIMHTSCSALVPLSPFSVFGLNVISLSILISFSLHLVDSHRSATILIVWFNVVCPRVCCFLSTRCVYRDEFRLSFLLIVFVNLQGMIVRPCNTAIIALAFSFYTLRPFYPDCDPPGDAVRLLAIICICMCSLYHLVALIIFNIFWPNNDPSTLDFSQVC